MISISIGRIKLIFTWGRCGAMHLTTALCVADIILAGCTASPVNTAQPPQPRDVKRSPLPAIKSPQLRLINQGSTAFKQLTVLFPQDRIAFGDIPAHATTAYKPVPHGVFGYAAYSLVVNGKKIIVRVIDWVGEKPMRGNAFTYTIKFVPNQRRIVELVKVTKDK